MTKPKIKKQIQTFSQSLAIPYANSKSFDHFYSEGHFDDILDPMA